MRTLLEVAGHDARRMERHRARGGRADRRGGGQPLLPALEQRLSDSVFKSVPQRIATTLTTLATRTDTAATKLRPGTRHPQIALTHEQLAALAGTSRETCTKALREFADRGLLRLARGRITVLDPGPPPRRSRIATAGRERPRAAAPVVRGDHRGTAAQEPAGRRGSAIRSVYIACNQEVRPFPRRKRRV